MLGAGKGVENGIRGMVTSVGANQVEMVFTLFTTNKPYAGYKEGANYISPQLNCNICRIHLLIVWI